MKRVNLVILVVSVLLLALGISLAIHSCKTSPEVRYSGQVVFYTEKDYSTFKVYLAQPEVTINDIQVLASEPPILVKYAITTPRNMEFPYTYYSVKSMEDNDALIITYAVLSSLGAVGILISLARQFIEG